MTIGKILITGSNGFIGSHLTDMCLNKGYEVYALDRPNASFFNLKHYTEGKSDFSKADKEEIYGEKIQIPSINENLFCIECDIKNAELLERIIKEVKPIYIFHLAAQPYILPSWEDPIDTIETNVIGTINIFESIKNNKTGSRVMLACTSAEFGTTARLVNRALKETDKLLAENPYGISKIAAELLARQYYLNFKIESVNVRFFNQTGIRRMNDATSDFIRKVAEIECGLKEPVIEVGNLSPYRDFTDIKDSLNAIWLAMTKGKPGENYHVCSNKKIQIRKILNIALSFASKKIEVKENISAKLRISDEDIIIGDNSKIKSELGWTPKTPIQDTLKGMFDDWMEYYKKK